MKAPFRSLPLFLTAALWVAATGCQSVSTRSNPYLGGPTYAPSTPERVQILRTMPSRVNVRLGEVTAEPSSDKTGAPKIEQALRKAAAKMGADAVVIVSDRTQVTGALVTGPWYNRTIQRTTSRVVIGVAIKYTGS